MLLKQSSKCILLSSFEFGEPWLMDTHTRETIELELRSEGFGADRSDEMGGKATRCRTPSGSAA